LTSIRSPAFIAIVGEIRTIGPSTFGAGGGGVGETGAGGVWADRNVERKRNVARVSHVLRVGHTIGGYLRGESVIPVSFETGDFVDQRLDVRGVPALAQGRTTPVQGTDCQA
jgi:hypothetical protein